MCMLTMSRQWTGCSCKFTFLCIYYYVCRRYGGLMITLHLGLLVKWATFKPKQFYSPPRNVNAAVKKLVEEVSKMLGTFLVLE